MSHEQTKPYRGRYWGEPVDLVKHIPSWSRNILLIGTGQGELALVLARRKNVTVWAVERRQDWVNLGASLLETMVYATPDMDDLPFKAQQFDTVIFCDLGDEDHFVARWMDRIIPLITPESLLVFYVPVLKDEKPRQIVGQRSLEPIAAQVQKNDFLLYRYWMEQDQEQKIDDYLLWFVQRSYNPVQHARHLQEEERYQHALELLFHIPPVYFEDDDWAMTIHQEMLKNMQGVVLACSAADLLYYTACAQSSFFEIVSRNCQCVEAYQNMAQFWHRLGDDSQANRLLSIGQQATPSSVTCTQQERRQHDCYEYYEAPEFRPLDQKPRILFVMHPRPHYGLDVLYDGLCEVLGDERVVEYPYKPLLHGSPPSEHKNYPCTCTRKGERLSAEAVAAQLRAGAFDFILYGDCENAVPTEEARMLLEAGCGLPVYLLDQIDEFYDTRKIVSQYLGGFEFQGYFKREMLHCYDYGQDAFPLPFAYADYRVQEETGEDRTIPVFWAGHRDFGVRQPFLQRLQRLCNESFNQQYSQAEYVQALQNAKIGLNLTGGGFDTVRYWELPAHGVMLLSHRLPIVIPQDFVDGKHAVFFDDIQGMEESIQYYLAHPEQIQTIAKSGYEHLKQYHLATKRAQQLLVWIAQLRTS